VVFLLLCFLGRAMIPAACNLHINICFSVTIMLVFFQILNVSNDANDPTTLTDFQKLSNNYL
jgi:hypothetical protein